MNSQRSDFSQSKLQAAETANAAQWHRSAQWQSPVSELPVQKQCFDQLRFRSELILILKRDMILAENDLIISVFSQNTSTTRMKHINHLESVS